MIKQFTILLFLVQVSFGACSQEEYVVSFEWHHDSLNGEFFEKTSMHIPVKLEGDTTTYYFQFDTGATNSYLYSGSSSDTVWRDMLTSEEGINSSVGKLNLKKKESNKIYTENGKTHIGTIGSDFLKTRKLK